MSSADVDTAETAETPEVDEARQGIVKIFEAELGDAVLGTHIRPGDDVWIRVDRAAWREAGVILRDRANCRSFEFLSAIDWMPSPYGKNEDSPTDPRPEIDPTIVTGYAGGDTRFQVFARALSFGRKMGVTLKTDIPDDDLTIDTWLSVYAGVNWHERELREMFGITAVGHPYLAPLYLPGEFEGHPLRKDFPLLAREVKPWPGIVDVEPMPEVAEDPATAEDADAGSAGAVVADEAEVAGESPEAVAADAAAAEVTADADAEKIDAEATAVGEAADAAENAAAEAGAAPADDAAPTAADAETDSPEAIDASVAEERIEAETDRVDADVAAAEAASAASAAAAVHGDDTEAAADSEAAGDAAQDAADTATADAEPDAADVLEATEASTAAAADGDVAPDAFDADGLGIDVPEGAIKGNTDSMKYHVPGSRWYDKTIAEVWFETVADAVAAGYEPAGGAAAQQVQNDEETSE